MYLEHEHEADELHCLQCGNLNYGESFKAISTLAPEDLTAWHKLEHELERAQRNTPEVHGRKLIRERRRFARLKILREAFGTPMQKRMAAAWEHKHPGQSKCLPYLN